MCLCTLCDRPQKIKLLPQEKVLKEHTYTAMTPQASPSIARNPKLKSKQGKVTLPHLKGDISGMLPNCLTNHVHKTILLFRPIKETAGNDSIEQ